MLTFTLRRLLLAIPTLLLISLVIFLLVDLAPGSPASEIPLTVPPEVRAKILEALGVNEPLHVRYLLWLKQFFWVEPLNGFDAIFGTNYAEGMQRIISYQTRGPVFDTIFERVPQTLLVVGMGYLVGVIIAIPIGIVSATRQYSWIDQLGTFISMVGFSVPTFVIGVVLIVVFSVWLGWFPSIYDTTLQVTDWESFLAQQVRQMVMPVIRAGAVPTPAQISRYMRASMLDNHGPGLCAHRPRQGPDRTGGRAAARPAQFSDPGGHGHCAWACRACSAGAIITENVFKRERHWASNCSCRSRAMTLPMVQTLAFIFAILIVFFNLIADLLYGMLDPRIRYD
jgi:peptide/nickel transport system permease protein